MNIEQLKAEFAGKTNHEAYELAFVKRLMRPDPNRPGAFLGNSQREDFAPHLLELVTALPAAGQIFDVGAGSGETIDTALKEAHGATVNLLEPNPYLLELYKKRLAGCKTLKLGLSYCGKIEDYYFQFDGRPPKLDRPQNLVLAIHMVYHLTDLSLQEIHPDTDIEKAVSTMYSTLAPGGTIFVVFANQLVSTTGLAARYYFKKISRPELAERHLQVSKSRVIMLQKGAIVSRLNEHFPSSKASLHSINTASCIYGEVQSDLVAMCMTGEIGEIDDAPFDLKKLDICAQFIAENQEAIGLRVEDRAVSQKGMFCSNQPQTISIIRRDA